MASTTHDLPNRTAHTADQCQPCPVCHGLECLCRPRFYAGQLLTEEDLNRLEQYVVKKNRLHNRYLHGWGVASGLEVVCDPCAKGVIVKPGYALSPCGDDIIVCQDSAVDVCALINACCRPELAECDPPRPRPAECDGEREWILSICYDEFPSRNQPSLTATCGCGSKSASCSCRGASKGGCGCHSASASGSTTKSSPAKPPVACQPTLTCESYRFVLTPASKKQAPKVSHYQECIAKLVALQVFPQPSTLDLLRTQCCQFADQLLNLIADCSITECALYDAINALCTLNGNTVPAAYADFVQRVTLIKARLLLAFFCLAVLPTCPEPALNNCVPLATLTVLGKDCRIIRICNFENRKFLSLAARLFELLGIENILETVFGEFCCRRVVQRPRGANVRLASATVQTHAMGTFLSAAMQRRATGKSMFTDMAEGQLKNLDAAELDDPINALLFNEVLSPLFEAQIPAGLSKTYAKSEVASLSRQAAASETKVKALTESLDEIKAHVRDQEVRIAGLTALLDKKK